MARLVRIVTLTVAALASLETLRLVVFGAISVVVGGHRIRSHDPLRPAEITLVALAVFAIAGGERGMVEAWHRMARVRDQMPVLGRLLTARVGALLLATAVFSVGASYATTVASGADGSGYVSQADRWIHGPLKPPEPWVGDVPWPNAAWTFTPLGYKPVDGAPSYAQAPTYSPGLPLMMAAAKIAGGQAALFLVVPLCGAVLTLATYGIGRRLRGPATGLAAAWLVATSPIAIWMLVLPMSDLPVTAAWAAAFYALLGTGTAAALTAGLLSAAAIVVRPNLFFLAPIMSLWFLVRVNDGATSWLRRPRDVAAYFLGVAPGVIFVAGLFNYLYGSPFVSGYGRFADLLDRGNVWPNLHRYVHWAMDTQATFTVAGLLGLVGAFFFWPRGNARRAITLAALVVAAVTIEYVFYIVFEDWTFLRFLLPAWPFLAVGTAGAVTTLVDRSPPAIKAIVVAGVIGLGIFGVGTARDRYAFDLWHGNRRYTAASVILDEISEPNSVVLSMEHSGSLRYYSGRVPIRYDYLPTDWLDHTIEWLAESGVHSYALLDDWEVKRFRDRFPDQDRVRILDAPIVVYHAYHDGAVVYLYDFTTPPRPGSKPKVITETDPKQWRSSPPGPLPGLVFRSRPR